jgi:hypothetical protein
MRLPSPYNETKDVYGFVETRAVGSARRPRSRRALTLFQGFFSELAEQSRTLNIYDALPFLDAPALASSAPSASSHNLAAL